MSRPRQLTNAEADKESEELRRASPDALIGLPCSLAGALASAPAVMLDWSVFSS
jgi:hypothetical protein